jgi:hypothetical protein
LEFSAGVVVSADPSLEFSAGVVVSTTAEVEIGALSEHAAITGATTISIARQRNTFFMLFMSIFNKVFQSQSIRGCEVFT